jgi:hypothetical protein
VADTKVSLLSSVAASALSLSDVIPIVSGGVSKNVTLDSLAQFADANYFCVLDADYTLTSTTSAQKLFNKSTNGALTLPTGLFYLFCQFQITGMSATSGNGVFSLAGAAVLANPRMLSAFGVDSTAMNTGVAGSAALVQGGTAFTTNTVLAATGTGMFVTIQGIFAVTTGGTIIPSIALTTAAAAVVKAGSCIIVNKIGAATDTTRGSWS